MSRERVKVEKERIEKESELRIVRVEKERVEKKCK